MGNAAEQTLSPQMVSASSMIQPGSLRVAEPDAPEASPEAGWPQCCQPIHLTHSLGNTTDVSAFLSDTINRLRRGQLDPRVANAMGYLTSVLLRSLEQGPIEERLAKIFLALINVPPPQGQACAHVFPTNF
jgi:hypothetical protein